MALLFLVAVGGQSYAGWKSYDEEQQSNHQPTVGYTRYLVSSDFYDNVMSNWQSEFLQISLYVMFAVWFRQRGSAESQDPDHPIRQSDKDEMLGEYLKPDSPKWARRGGWRLRIFENSLLISMGVLFFLSWFAMAAAQHNTYNADQMQHHQAGISLVGFLGDFLFLERDLPELAVGVPGRRCLRRGDDLFAPTRFDGVKTRRRAA